MENNMQQIDNNFKGKQAIILGGSSGIGLAVAMAFYQRGCDLLLGARSLERLEQAKAEIESSNVEGGSVQILSIDCGEGEKYQKKLEEELKRLGQVDYLFYASGVYTPQYFEETDPENFNSTIDINLKGAWFTAQAVIPYLKQSRGVLTFVSSLAAFIGAFGYSAYGPSKSAVNNLAETLRMEMLRHDVRVNVLCPPDTATPGHEEEKKIRPLESDAIAETSRVFTAEEVAEVYFKGLKRKSFYIIPGWLNRVIVRVNRWMPWLVYQMLLSGVKKMQKRMLVEGLRK